MDQRIESVLPDLVALHSENRMRTPRGSSRTVNDLPVAGAEQAHEVKAAHATRAVCQISGALMSPWPDILDPAHRTRVRCGCRRASGPIANNIPDKPPRLRTP